MYPDAQFVEDGVVGVYPAVAVLVVFGEVGEAVAAQRAEELAAIVYFARAVSFCQEARTAEQAGDLAFRTRCVQVEGHFCVAQAGERRVEVDYEGVDEFVDGDLGEIEAIVDFARHVQGEVDVEFAAVFGCYVGFCAEAYRIVFKALHLDGCEG